MQLKILHTNDIHSRFENFARISKKIEELRDENTIVLDAGDFHDFMSIEIQGTKGAAGSSFLNVAGYDAVTIGNNEGFSGIKNIENMTNTQLIPYLSCNLYKADKSLIKGVKRSIIIDKSGVKFLIIGATPAGPSYNEFFSLENMYASNPIEEINKEIFNNKGKYDICVFLSHLGINADKEIAKKIEGIDIIIGGHSHTLMDEVEVINGKIIHQSGMLGEYLGVLNIEIENGSIKTFSSENLNIKEVPLQDKMLKEISKQKEIAIEVLSEPLYEVERNLWHDVIEESPITNLLADALRDVIPCDLSIINSGILSGGIKKGFVSNKKLLEICPSPLNPTYVEIMGKDIKQALEASLRGEVCLQDGRGAGFRGKYLGRLHISGAKIKHDGKNIIDIILENGEFNENKLYSVATSDYLQRGTGYESLGRCKNEKYNKDYLRDTLREYLSKKDFVEKCFEERWLLLGDIKVTRTRDEKIASRNPHYVPIS
ncbi:bifunctional metallophosphatase/5'-nucleotidase [Clostridium tagluense]|uniref:bifunctional metallophosphatase/5'-nucleotidase n=1 Tax=Clostridium tagluense TaxID=360422 RepID=UPI001CF3BE8F|nr:bifunctional UDP-sugar hydrolase/5'-nucleotidase [Clostridium tagluense]MCB2312771.1 bifunctional metallophosphatase/5'-nucleotidase [Clostridium tagluense]MCB2317537.1 bifunctional metallophosphatase/5'-nucleotidase [Clostridium tagluense]MCB2322373.1 bifunctional metallophosphatase/5'-nucleotidase [Clostridium tagluense]MCB2327376.1 bifunctional metallophosphatase/5'-nucleotidase [Clostridium tagluense]MCB2332095.1 bifunctional metallophosphatase/5'-nucleotidase [Clostridium tagluense]